MVEPTASGIDDGRDLISIPDAAELLGIDVAKFHQLVRDGQLVVAVGEDGQKRIPRVFVAGGSLLKGLRAVITLLRDARYSDAEIIDWLFRPDDSLPGTPAKALAGNRGTEVKRRAQVAGF
jgi:hypothetical protein